MVAALGGADENGATLFLEDMALSIGWAPRLVESDAFSKRMPLRDYLKFSKCREAALTSSPSKFWKWLRTAEYHRFTRWCLNFVAWDRIGCIVQIARALNGNVIGEPISCHDDALRPTQIVQSILKINSVAQLTPFPFSDGSFGRIDLSNVPSIKSTMEELRREKLSATVPESASVSVSESATASKGSAATDTAAPPLKKRKIN